LDAIGSSLSAIICSPLVRRKRTPS
jgi:hypothetical protein